MVVPAVVVEFERQCSVLRVATSSIRINYRRSRCHIRLVESQDVSLKARNSEKASKRHVAVLVQTIDMAFLRLSRRSSSKETHTSL